MGNCSSRLDDSVVLCHNSENTFWIRLTVIIHDSLFFTVSTCVFFPFFLFVILPRSFALFLSNILSLLTTPRLQGHDLYDSQWDYCEYWKELEHGVTYEAVNKVDHNLKAISIIQANVGLQSI